MASRNPAAFLGLEEDIGRIAPGCFANLVLVTDTSEVLGTWIDGRGIEES
jgi:N-acetylglucosamine-6-phosphate deacetylase